MDAAKIRLSAEELALLKNADWILTKNAILEKIKQLLSGLQDDQRDWLQSQAGHLPEEALLYPPKISRGEQYRGLPYLVLDYPRYFGKQDVFAVRSFFWWGNFFSVTLQLDGKFKQQYEPAIRQAYAFLKENDFFIGVNKDPWQHHFDEDNYQAVAACTAGDFAAILNKNPVIKLVTKIPLDEWEVAGERLLERFKQVLSIVAGEC